MTNTNIQKIVTEKINSLIQTASKSFDIPTNLHTVPVTFGIRGKTAGCVSFDHFKGTSIEFNMTLLKDNLDTFLSSTVPHEVAHYVVWCLHGHEYSRNGKRVIHGANWKHMMGFFGVDAKRCHNYDTSKSTVRRVKRFTYVCNCQEHELTIIRHNKIQRGKATYTCQTCGTKLTLKSN